MYRIKLVTDSLNYAAGFAGAVISAREFVQKKANKPFDFCIESNNPAIYPLMEAFPSQGGDWEIIELPESEIELAAYDRWDAERTQTELVEGYGMMLDSTPGVSLCTYDRISSAILKAKYDLHNKASYWYPELTKSQLQGYAVDAVVTFEDFIEKAEEFLKGFTDKPGPFNIQVAKDDLEAIKYYKAGTRVLVSQADDPINCVALASYKGFDFLTNTPPVLLLTPEDYSSLDLRACCNWAAGIPCGLVEPGEAFYQRGKVWGIRAQHNFDHHEYQKAVSKR